MEGNLLKHSTAVACAVCGGNADIDIDDGAHYLCAAHAAEPMTEIDITDRDPIVTIADAPTSVANVVMMGETGSAPGGAIADADVRKLFLDVTFGLRAIRHRLESRDAS